MELFVSANSGVHGAVEMKGHFQTVEENRIFLWKKRGEMCVWGSKHFFYCPHKESKSLEVNFA